jgi:hypothetical protein
MNIPRGLKKQIEKIPAPLQVCRQMNCFTMEWPRQKGTAYAVIGTGKPVINKINALGLDFG